jgi:hypothetical protein
VEAVATRVTGVAPKLTGVVGAVKLILCAAFVLVSVKIAGVRLPIAAVTVYCPAIPFAVAFTVVWPALFVDAGAESDALAPFEAGVTLKVTVAPEIGLPYASVTVACNAVPKLALITADCGVPLEAVRLLAAAGLTVIAPEVAF